MHDLHSCLHFQRFSRTDRATALALLADERARRDHFGSLRIPPPLAQSQASHFVLLEGLQAGTSAREAKMFFGTTSLYIVGGDQAVVMAASLQDVQDVQDLAETRQLRYKTVKAMAIPRQEAVALLHQGGAGDGLPAGPPAAAAAALPAPAATAPVEEGQQQQQGPPVEEEGQEEGQQQHGPPVAVPAPAAAAPVEEGQQQQQQQQQQGPSAAALPAGPLAAAAGEKYLHDLRILADLHDLHSCLQIYQYINHMFYFHVGDFALADSLSLNEESEETEETEETEMEFEFV